MALTEQEEEELAALETIFDNLGGRGVDNADRIDFLRNKQYFPTVAELVAHLQKFDNPTTTFATLALEIAAAPGEFVLLDNNLLIEAQDQG